MLIYKVIQKLKELYPKIEIVLWTRGEYGKLRVNDIDILKNVNINLLEKQLTNGGENAEREILLYFAEYIESRYINSKKRAVGAGRPPINLTEAQVKYAVENSQSNHQAAAFLKIQDNTYKKYAKMYGLYDAHNNMGGKGVLRKRIFRQRVTLENVFANKHPNINMTVLKRRLVYEQMLVDKCEICGEDRPRNLDGMRPILLDCKDGNFKNFALENLRLICYNCAFRVRGKVQLNFSKKISNQMKHTDVQSTEAIKDSGDDIFDKFNKK